MARTYVARGNDKINVSHSALIDLSGAAVAQTVMEHFTRAAMIEKINILYVEASSADAGVALKVGREGDDDGYYTGTSAVSQNAWDEVNVTPLAKLINAGDSLTYLCAGSKTGTGTVIITVEWRFVE
jgi:hypothetical protein